MYKGRHVHGHGPRSASGGRTHYICVLHLLCMLYAIFVVQDTLCDVRRPRLLIGPRRTPCHHPPSPRSIPCVLALAVLYARGERWVQMPPL